MSILFLFEWSKSGNLGKYAPKYPITSCYISMTKKIILIVNLKKLNLTSNIKLFKLLVFDTHINNKNVIKIHV